MPENHIFVPQPSADLARFRLRPAVGATSRGATASMTLARGAQGFGLPLTTDPTVGLSSGVFQD